MESVKGFIAIETNSDFNFYVRGFAETDTYLQFNQEEMELDKDMDYKLALSEFGKIRHIKAVDSSGKERVNCNVELMGLNITPEGKLFINMKKLM